MAQIPELIWDILETIRICVCSALDATGGDNCCPCNSFVTLGEVAWDDCCNGTLYVKADKIYVHSNFPQVSGEPVFCNSPLAMDVVVGILRCAPVIDNNGTPPTPKQISDASKIVYTDAYQAETAIICCLAQERRRQKFVMRNTTFLGPRGGCQGVEIRLTTEIDDSV